MRLSLRVQILALLAFLLVNLAQINAQNCTSRYGKLYTGTCTSQSSCTGALLNNLCPGAEKCCIRDTGSASTTNSFISQTNFLNIVGDNDRTKAIYRYLQTPITRPACFQTASFISQLAHESNRFMAGEELGTESSFSKYDNRTDLGNTEPGDGAKYRGRGFIQLTGRANYRRAGADLKLALEDDPELAAFPSVAARIAVWFWQKGSDTNLNDLADGTFYSYSIMTEKINGGINGLVDRTQLLLKSSELLKCGKIFKGSGESCRIDNSTMGTCRPLCVKNSQDFCGCQGKSKTGQCKGPKNMVCCIENCDGIMDMTFVIDSSGSIDNSDFKKALEFVEQVINHVNVNESGTQVAIINYSADIEIVAFLNNYTVTSQLLNAVRNIQQLDQSTYTGEALEKCKLIYNEENGMRNESFASTKLIIVLTDGASNGLLDPIAVSSDLKRSNIHIISIGVGQRYNLNIDELSGISSSGDYFILSSYEEVIERVQDLTQIACTKPAVITETTMELTIGKDSMRYFRYSLENYTNATISIHIDTKQGKSRLFSSFDNRNPNDYSVIIDTYDNEITIENTRLNTDRLEIPVNATDLYIGVKGLEDENRFVLIIKSGAPIVKFQIIFFTSLLTILSFYILLVLLINIFRYYKKKILYLLDISSPFTKSLHIKFLPPNLTKITTIIYQIQPSPVEFYIEPYKSTFSRQIKNSLTKTFQAELFQSKYHKDMS